jgi:hypothetical protein
MSSLRQIEANRRNAQVSTGPVTEDGKRRSRRNAVRHGLTAETVISALEDAEDYAAFEMSVASDYHAQSAVERELVLRLASVLWRLRRATAIETGLFQVQLQQLLEFGTSRRVDLDGHRRPASMEGDALTENDVRDYSDVPRCGLTPASTMGDELTRSFIHLNGLPTCPLDRLSRYEATLWRQACQILFTLHCLGRHRSWGKPKRF